jgi:hypothetical protein
VALEKEKYLKKIPPPNGVSEPKWWTGCIARMVCRRMKVENQIYRGFQVIVQMLELKKS